MSHRFVAHQQGSAFFMQPLDFGDIAYDYFCRLGCSANFWPARDGETEETKSYFNELKQVIGSRWGGSNSQVEGFYMYLKILNVTSDDGSASSKLFGSVHGKLFKDIYEELELLEPVQLKLEIVFGVPLDTKVIKISTQEMNMSMAPKDTHMAATYYTFEQTFPAPWPVTICDSGVDCFLKSELIYSPYPQPGLQLSPSNGSLQIAVMTKTILETGLHSDFTLISENGDRFPCHKVFLAPSSQFFATMFKTDMMESHMSECRLDGSTQEGVSALLKFVYYQDVQEPLTSSGLCVELLHLALMYDIPTLAHCVRNTMLSKRNSWWDIGGAVSLYFRVRLENGYANLKDKAIQILKTKRARGEIMSNANSHFEDLCVSDPNALKELMQLMFCS
ncbi:Kelch-like protein 40 [Orchesella cincta]|uniref:Kelch-like protein 40 n=1 Tax=Orchesella cincta TaxID=48709 RepID=A0A1D2MDP8_ORCCI|nr:Kelch-like protein 40 [Orchesella cincta]